MAAPNPIFVKATTAAALLDMTLAEFLALVEVGALPAPIMVGGRYERWDVAQIKAVLGGENIQHEDFEI